MQNGSNGPDDSARRTQIRALVEAARRQAGGLSQSVEYVSAKALDNPNFLPGYCITEVIHRGGQGVVYQARQQSTGRRVAVKVMREGPFGGPRDFARFEREVRILGQLVHPNIVTILDSGTTSGNSYFIMDHILGIPLDQWVRDGQWTSTAGGPADSASRSAGGNSQSSLGQTLRLFVKVCDAVHVAHLRGIIHRDLKPNNILIDFNGEPHILDFGLAKFDEVGPEASAVTTTGHFVGSLPWASPEQAAGDSGQIDIRTDVYSIGVMLYQALVGRFPYSVACGVRDALDRIIHAEPARPSSVARDLNDELDTIILKCLAKDPERRYESAGALARDLRHYLAEEPLEAKRDSTWYVLRRTIRRHRVLVVALLAVFVIILGSSVFAFSLMLKARRSEENAQWNLRDSLLGQARARRQVITEGRRSEALQTLSRAAAIRPGFDLRNEVIATLALPDLSRQLVPSPPDAGAVVVSNDSTLSAFLLPDRSACIERVTDGVEVARIPPPADIVEERGRWFCNSSFFIRSFRRPRELQELEVWQIPETILRLTITDIPKGDEFDVAPDGRTLAVGRSDQAIHFYDMVTAQDTKRLPLDRNAAHLRFDPSGQKLVRYHGRDGEASVLDLKNDTWSRVFHQSEISYAAAWSPDGRLLAGAQDDLIQLWDVLENKPLAVLRGHDSGVVQLGFSNDSRLLTSYGWEGVSMFWDLRTLRPILRSDLSGVSFASDDRMLGGLATMDGVLRVFRCRFLFQDAYRFIGADFGTDRFKAHSGAVHPSGRLAVAAFTDRTKKAEGLEWFDLARHSVVGRIECGSIDLVRFHPSGSSLFTMGSNGLLKWPIRLAETAIQLGPPQQLAGESRAEQFDLSDTGRRLALVSPGENSTLTVLDTEHSDEHFSYQCLPKALNIAVSPNGKWAVVSTWLGEGGEVWDLDSGRLMAQLNLAGGAIPKFSPDGRWLTIREWSYLRFLNPGTWDEAHRLSIRLGSRVGFSRDGRVAAVGDNRNIIHLIDTKTFAELALLEAPELMAIADIPCFIDDSKLVVFGSPGATLQLWDFRFIRSTLASMGLDWDHPPIPPAETPDSTSLLHVEADLGYLGAQRD